MQVITHWWIPVFRFPLLTDRHQLLCNPMALCWLRWSVWPKSDQQLHTLDCTICQWVQITMKTGMKIQHVLFLTLQRRWIKMFWSSTISNGSTDIPLYFSKSDSGSWSCVFCLCWVTPVSWWVSPNNAFVWWRGDHCGAEGVQGHISVSDGSSIPPALPGLGEVIHKGLNYTVMNF